MKSNHDPTKIKTILSEADELLGRLNAGLIVDMEETRRIQLELQANELKNRRLEAQAIIEKEKSPDLGSFGQGIHAAIDEIVSAMKTLKSYLT